MKLTKRILSVMLVLSMVLAMCPAIIFAEETESTTVEAVKLTNLGYAAQETGLKGMSGTDNVHYLSDLYNNPNYMVDQLNSKVVLDQNYNGDLYTFDGSSATNSARKQIAANLTNGFRTLANGITYRKSDIALGAYGVKYEKGLGVHPDAVGSADRYIIYNVSDLDVDHFYAVVGGTGTNITDLTITNQLVTFELWGATAVDGEYTKLAYAEKIRAYLVAEFDVDITGYNYIKLVVKMTSGSNSSCAVAWGNACVYRKNQPETITYSTLNRQTLLKGKAANAANVQYLSDLYSTNVVANTNSSVKLDKNYNDSLFAFVNGSRAQIAGHAETDANGNRTITANGVEYTFNKSEIAMGHTSVHFEKGLGVHPNGVGAADRYLVYDVRGLGADYFYAVAGATGSNITNPSATNRKVIFELWGSKSESYDENGFVKLAYVDQIRAYLLGEFNVKITGYNFIKLVVKMNSASVDNSSCAVAWGDACVYKDPYAATDNFTNHPATTGNALIPLYETYHACAPVVSLADTSKVKASYVMPASGSTDPRAVGVKKIFNGTTTSVGVGYPNTTYDSFLSLHVSASTHASDTYAILDVQGLGDRFYSLVGIYGEARKATTYGAVYRVYGSKADTYDADAYELLACSGAIYGYNTGVFDVDITGYNFLKLEVARPEGQTANNSSAVAWINPAVYSNTLVHTEETITGSAPTCEGTGLSDGVKCSVCGEILTKQEEIPANGHAWNDGEITTAPGCESEGVKTYTCGTCGETKTEAVDPNGHDWNDATCTDPQTCKNCDATQGEALGHSWNDGVITTAPGCESEGVKTYTCGTCGETKTEAVDPNGHSWKDATCTAPETCSVCGATQGEALGHSWNDGEITTAPGCVNEGVKTYTCGTCGETKTEAVAPNGHDWNDATCIDPETCSVCGATQGEALGHAWDDGVVTKDPTTTETGIKTYTCGSCGETKEEILPVIAVGTLEIGSVTLSLDDLVYLHVFYDYVNGGLSREYLEANGGLIYWFDEASAITVPGLTWNESNSRYMGVTNGIAMKDLSDTMMVQSYLQLPDGTYIYSEVTEYSGKKYAESRINKIDALENPSEKELAERDVCIALLNAITAAQNFFDHNAESPANGSLSEDRQNVNFSGDMLNPAAPADANKSPARDSDVFTGRYTSLDLEGRTEISFYFAIDEGVMATAQSSGILFWTEEAYNNAEFLDASNATRDLELEYFESTDRYGAKYPDGFAAKEYETTVYACAYVVDADGNYHYSGVIAYSVETYCNSKINKGAAEAELCKALVVYGEAAKAYFAI